MSTPAQNPRPSAASTTTRVPGSAPASVTAAARSYQPLTGSALTGGKSITTSATPSATLTSTLTAAPPSACLPPRHRQGARFVRDSGCYNDQNRGQSPLSRLALLV